MKNPTRLSTAFGIALTASLSACGTEVSVRAGSADFATEFPNYDELVTCDDVDSTFERLEATDRPETDEHHAELLRLARETDPIDLAHVKLLVAAVARDASKARLLEQYGMTDFASAGGSDFKIVINGVDVTDARGTGEYAHVVDEILAATVARVDDVSPADAPYVGWLLGRTESTESLLLVAEHLVPQVDDGSADALAAILDGFDRGGALREFVEEVLLKEDRLAGEREWVALEHIGLDSLRTRIATVGIEKRDGLDVETLQRYLMLLSVDANRLAVLQSGAAKLDGLDLERTIELVRMLTVDSNKTSAIATLEPLVDIETLYAATRVASELSVDSNRLATFTNLASDIDAVDAESLVQALSTLSVDSNRLSLASQFAARVAFDGFADLRDYVNAFSVDSNRLAALSMIAKRLGSVELSEEERAELADLLTVRSNRATARVMLGLERED